jgi:hypothetical protein
VAARREAYSAFLSAVDAWDNLDYEAAMRGEIEEWPDTPPEDTADALTGVMTTARLRPRANAAGLLVHKLLTDIELYGSTQVFGRARALRDQVRALGAARREWPPRDCGGASRELNDRQERFLNARDAYVSAVRKDLGA